MTTVGAPSPPPVQLRCKLWPPTSTISASAGYLRSSILVVTNWKTTPANSRTRTNPATPTRTRFVHRQSRLPCVFIGVNPFSGVVVPENVCTFLWGTASLTHREGHRSAAATSKPLSAHPVSPSAIQLGTDESLWILNAHRTPEEPVDDDHQGHYQDSANEARRKWVRHRETWRHPKGV